MQTTTSLVFNSDSINSDSFNCCFYQEMQHVRATVQSDCTKEQYQWDQYKSDQYRGPAPPQNQNNEKIDIWPIQLPVEIIL